MSVKVEINDWKKLDNEQIKIVKLTSASGFQVELLSLGATIYSAKYPGDKVDVVLGFDNPSGYDGTGNPFFWGTTGRLTNRVKNGKFKIDGLEYQLSKNDFGNDHRHHLHGGNKSFDRLNWNTSLAEEGDGVVFSILSPHGSEGYPGNLIASVKYSLKEECHLDIEMCAATDRATVVNISNHVYFNLAGHGSGWEGMQQQSLQIHADTFTPGDEDYLPTGEILPVRGTEFDFLTEKSLGKAVPTAMGGEGYCVNYCVGGETGGLRHVATLSHPEQDNRLEVWSDQPGLELYTANFLPSPGAGLAGKEGAEYCRWGGVCLMTQNYRDAPNHHNFPSPVVRPGHLYTHRASYRFY